MTAKTLYRKIVDLHTIKNIDDDTVLLYVDAHFANEYTSPQAFAGLRERGVSVFKPDAHLCVVDHIIPTADTTPRIIQDADSARQAQNLEQNCRYFGIEAFYGPNDPHQGIEHIVMQEQGLVRPGMVVICGDSHTTTHGALGALAFGIGTSEIEHILATQTLVYRLAKTMRIRIDGRLVDGVTAKDLILFVLRQISASGALGHVVEYSGSAVQELDMAGRMTLCNLTVEAGARGALIAPDDKTVEWVRTHALDLDEAMLETAKNTWSGFVSDAGAVFDREVSVDATQVTPMVTWGTSPDQVIGIGETIPAVDSILDPIERAAAERALAYQGLREGMCLQGLPVQHVFIGSCTNARIEDLRAAASIVRGRYVAPGVRAQVIPGSMQIRRQAEQEELDRIFKDAGFEWRKSGCSLCLAMNDDILDSGVRCASTSNRNFEGRQGRGSRTHLVSPQMAAAAAVTGSFVDWRTLKAI